MLSTPELVLDFWFDPAVQPRWFGPTATFDGILRERFGRTLEAARRGELDAWADTPQGWLALLIVRDQFSRNLYRNDARAWSDDPAVQKLALDGIARGFDHALPPLQRVFAYMPLEHAEDRILQDRCLQLFEQWLADAPPEEQPDLRQFLDYARKHHDVIERFGRFPHRNAILGRVDTPAERAYLASPGAGF